MFLLALLMALTAPDGQEAANEPARSAESRSTFLLEAANAAAAAGIPKILAEAPGKGVVLPRTLYMPDLTGLYPPVALRGEQQGLVRLRCTLTAEGRLDACSLVESSGAPLLEKAAFEVAKYARYSPQIVDRVPVASEVILPVRWVIEG